MQKTDYDTIVVGAGPAGNRLAYLLARNGHKTLVLEKERSIGKTTCCTGIVSEDCLSLISPKGGIASRETSSALFFSPCGKSLRVSKEGMKVYILDRLVLDQRLAALAEEQGAHFQLGSKVTDIGRSNGHIEVRFQEGAKAPVMVSARGVAIASGFGSSLPQKVGMGRVKDFVMGAQVDVRISGANEAEVYFDQDMATGFYAWLVPLSGERGLAGLFSTRDVGPRLSSFLAMLSRNGKIAGCESEVSYGGIPLRPLSKTYGDGILVMGDAAGQVKPTTGGGIYYGLLCSDMAAGAMHKAALAGCYSSPILSHYEKAWRKKLDWELRIGYWARSLYRRLNNSQIDGLFDLAQKGGLHQWLLHGENLSFDWHGPIIRRALSHEAVKAALQVLLKGFLKK